MLTAMLAMGLSAETAVFVAAAAAWLIAAGFTLAEAGAVAVVTVFMFFSLIHQIDLFTGSMLPGLLLETAGLLGIMAGAFHHRHRRLPLVSAAGRLMRSEPFAGGLLAIAWAIMAGVTVVGWSTASPTPVGGLVDEMVHGGLIKTVTFRPVTPLNTTALFFHATRFGVSPAAIGFGVLAHMAVALATYTLARRHAWPPMAMTVTLMVASMPRLVFMALNPSGELMTATAVGVAMVLLYRLLEQHRSTDFWLFLFSVLFSIRADPMSLALGPVLLVLLVVVMIRRHGWLLCREMVMTRPLLSGLLLVPVAILAQVPAFGFNLGYGHPLFGATVAFDTDGLHGAAANLLRYLLVSVDPTEPLRRALDWLVGLNIGGLVAGLNDLVVVRFFGQAGAAVPFEALISGNGKMGFGPIAPLMLWPTVGYALMRGTRRLKAVAVAWAGYLYLAALVVAWQDQSIAVLSPLYVANGFAVAFSIPPWRLRRRGMRTLQAAFGLLLAWALVRAATHVFTVVWC